MKDVKFLEIHEKCEGCDKVQPDKTCKAYLNPSYWWDRGGCPLSTNTIISTEKEQDEKRREGQQKQLKKR